MLGRAATLIERGTDSSMKLLGRTATLIERGADPSMLLYKVVIVQDSVIVLPASFLPRFVRGHHAALLRLTSEATEIYGGARSC